MVRPEIHSTRSHVKLRRIPEDFQVDEQADVEIGQGPHALYRLTKRSMGMMPMHEMGLSKLP